MKIKRANNHLPERKMKVASGIPKSFNNSTSDTIIGQLWYPL